MTSEELTFKPTTQKQLKSARRLVLGENILTADETALMTDKEICSLLSEKFLCLYAKGENNTEVMCLVSKEAQILTLSDE